MEEMNQLAKALTQCKTFKDRQQHLMESLDTLSFMYPDIYVMLFREMKKRELEFNDPYKITKWLGSSKLNSYTKLHEALLLVKSHNIMAKEEYMDNIKRMLCQTIEKGTDIKIAVKICDLIVKSPHLASIHEHMKDLIQRVYQLNNNRSAHMDNNCKEWSGHINEVPIVDAFKQLNAQSVPYVQPQHTPIWPTLLQPTSLNSAQGLPYFSLNCFGYDHFEMTATVNRRPTYDIPHTFTNLTIISQEMDEAVDKWLHYLKLHKYQWFFNSLSYLEIEFIDEDNIEGFISKVNKNYITKGAQKKICISTKALRDRKQKLDDLIMALDLEVTPNELCEFITYMKDILNYPIPNKNCVVGDQLQQDIVIVMEKFLNQLLEKLEAVKFLVAQSLLGSSINKYLECTVLITNNQVFMKEQYDKTLILAEVLKQKVQKMPKTFH